MQSLLGGISAAGVLAIAAFVFRTWIKGLIDRHFTKGIERLRHAQAKELEVFRQAQSRELEQLRFDFGRILSRASRLHEIEADILATTWKRLKRATGSVGTLKSPFRERPDFDQMDEDYLREAVSSSRLTDTDKKRLLEAKDKGRFYNDRIFFYELRDAQKGLDRFKNYVILNSLFFTKDMLDKLFGCLRLLQGELISQSVSRQARDRGVPMIRTDQEEYEKAEALSLEILELIRKRLEVERA